MPKISKVTFFATGVQLPNCVAKNVVIDHGQMPKTQVFNDLYAQATDIQEDGVGVVITLMATDPRTNTDRVRVPWHRIDVVSYLRDMVPARMDPSVKAPTAKV